MLAIWEEGHNIARCSEFPSEDRNLDIFKSKIPQLLNVETYSNTKIKIPCGPNKTRLWVRAGWFESSGIARRWEAPAWKGQVKKERSTKRLRRSNQGGEKEAREAAVPPPSGRHLDQPLSMEDLDWSWQKGSACAPNDLNSGRLIGFMRALWVHIIWVHLDNFIEQTKLIYGGKVIRTVVTLGGGDRAEWEGGWGSFLGWWHCVLYLEKGLGHTGVHIYGTLKICAFHGKFYLGKKKNSNDKHV